MTDITVAIDEPTADDIIDTAIELIPAQTASDSGNLGPFVASYSVTASFSPGNVDLIAPGTIRIADFEMDASITLSIGIDLSAILPDFCLPQVCIDIPCVGRVCTPEICIDWPTISVPVTVSDSLRVTADFGLVIARSGGTWRVAAVIQGVPSLQFGAITAAILAAVGAALRPILMPIPFIGPFLALAVDAVLLAIGVAGVTGLLGPMLTPFVSGMEFLIYQQPATFQALAPTSAADPAVFITIDALNAFITSTDEDELVLTAEIS